MATKIFGPLRASLIQKLAELERQIDHLRGDYPFDPHELSEALRLAINGEFPGDQSSKLDIRHAFNPDRFLPW